MGINFGGCKFGLENTTIFQPISKQLCRGSVQVRAMKRLELDGIQIQIIGA